MFLSIYIYTRTYKFQFMSEILFFFFRRFKSADALFYLAVCFPPPTLPFFVVRVWRPESVYTYICPKGVVVFPVNSIIFYAVCDKEPSGYSRFDAFSICFLFLFISSK